MLVFPTHPILKQIFLLGELEIQAYYFIGLLFFFLNIYVFASIVIFADFHRILAATGANAVKCCEISNSQMLWEIPLTAFDTLTAQLIFH